MLRKNEEREGIVVAIGSECEGVIKEDDGVVFVPFTLKGEKVRYKVLKSKDGCAYGKALEILTPAEERVRPVCPAFGKCGGCRLQHVKYPVQLKLKEKNVENCFKKIAGLDVSVSSAAHGDEFGYRNNLQLPVAEQNGETVVGFYAENSHRVVSIEDCPINAPWTGRVIAAVKSFINEYGYRGYDETTGRGDLREITVKEVKGNLLITLVTPDKNFGGAAKFEKILEQTLKYPFALYVNVNPAKTNVIYGDEFRLIKGPASFSAEMLGVKYKAGVRSFMQVNSSVCNKLYSAVLAAAGADEDVTVIDAYSGAGVMTALLAGVAKKAIGIEIVPEAVAFADEVKKVNHLENKMHNILGKCEDILPDVVKKEKSEGGKVTVVLDPPRKGCDGKVIKSLSESDIDKNVYVTCKPSTLARDVGLLVGSLEFTESGGVKRAAEYSPRYEITLVKPFDMFAQTKHVETLVCLSKKSEKHINIDVEFGEAEGQISLKKLQEELNEQKPKKKTTYKDIQKWVEENYGFKVHTAYIAEVKRDLGLPMYDAPNAVEELKRPRSHPTAEMSDAIKAALKHFEII